MLNTTAPLFTNDTFELTIERQQAELYSRLFALMVEDFPTNTDVNNYLRELHASVLSLQQQLTTLFQVVSSHTHVIPPHTHPILPHTHIGAGPGNPTSPNIGGLITAPTPLATNIPVQASSIKWTNVSINEKRNTTGVEPNLVGSTVTVGPSLDGPLIQTKRRLKTPTILSTTKTIPPLLKGSIF